MFYAISNICMGAIRWKKRRDRNSVCIVFIGGRRNGHEMVEEILIFISAFHKWVGGLTRSRTCPLRIFVWL